MHPHSSGPAPYHQNMRPSTQPPFETSSMSRTGARVCRLAARSSRFGLVALVVSTAGYEWPMSKLATDRGRCKRKPRMRGRRDPIHENGSYCQRDDSFCAACCEQHCASLDKQRRVSKVGRQAHVLVRSTPSSIAGNVIVCPSHSAQNSSTRGSTTDGL
ncbi:hypothetical protein IQ06DRAFT_14230 [Phaeosphaeriaceae sp. SRC1lsM3a]|nr:hypothetical protein IQ06DRAFT_14230 [Stagonospora sp. SRC1lsM3a]